MKCTACHKRLRALPEEMMGARFRTKGKKYLVRTKTCVQDNCKRKGDIQLKEVHEILSFYKNGQILAMERMQ